MRAPIPLDEDTPQVIALGEQEGFGIGFSPDAEGSTVGYAASMVGGDLLSGFDLADNARAPRSVPDRELR